MGPLGGKRRPLIGKVGKWYVESCHLKGCSPRLCLLRTNGWPPQASIEHTDRMLVYGPSKPSSMSSAEACLKPTASLAVRGEKLGGDTQIGHRCARDVVRNPYFSGVVGSIKIYW
jgi:hypothetical protein